MSFTWLIFIPILAVMVIIHEMGHLLTARLFKMKVNEFGIGFPPRLTGFTKWGILWSINALPIGGFVRILGENGDSTASDSFGAKPAWQRAIVLASGALMNLVLALVLFYIVALGGTDVASGRPGIISVEPASPAAQAGLQPGDLFVSIDGNKVETTSDAVLNITLKADRPIVYVMERKGQTYTTTITPRATPPEGEGATGVTLNNISSPVILTGTALPNGLMDHDIVTAVNGQPVSTQVDLDQIVQKATSSSVVLSVNRKGQAITFTVPLSPQISYVFKGSNAEKAGVQAGMLIKAVNGQPVQAQADFTAALQANQGKEIAVDLWNPTTKQVATYRFVAGVGTPKLTNVLPNIAELIPPRHIDYGIIGSAPQAVSQALFWTGLIPRTFDALFHGSIKVNSVAGPIGMAQLTGQVVDSGGGWLALLNFTAILSINLFVFNLLPIPALDGGRFFFVLIEIVLRGRRVPPEREGLVHLVGMAVLLTFIALISWQDIVRIISGSGFSS